MILIKCTYVLHRVNHSVWFGQGNFHTNTVEGLWGCLKRISNNFTGVNFKLLNELENNGIKPKDYIYDWICYCLFKRELEKKKLNEEQSRDYLFYLLTYN